MWLASAIPAEATSRRWYSVAFAVLWLLSPGLAQADKVVGFTEEFPPYNYSVDGEVKGLMTAVVNALLEEVGVSAEFRVYPWARSYKRALETPNAFVFSIARSEQREDLFKWLGPILEARHYLFSLNDRSDISLSSITDLQGYRVGTIRNSIREQFLLTVADELQLIIVSGSTVEGNFEQLRRGKIDLWAANPMVAAYTQVKELGPGQNILTPALHMSEIETPYYIGFNSQFDDALFERFSAALTKLREDGTLDFIINREMVTLGLGLTAIEK